MNPQVVPQMNPQIMLRDQFPDEMALLDRMRTLDGARKYVDLEWMFKAMYTTNKEVMQKFLQLETSAYAERFVKLKASERYKKLNAFGRIKCEAGKSASDR